MNPLWDRYAASRRSMVFQSAISVAAVTAVLCAAATAALVWTERERFEEKLIDDAKQNAAQVASFIVGYFYGQNNFMHLRNTQVQIDKSPHVLYSYIVDEAGKIDLGVDGYGGADSGMSHEPWEPVLPFELMKTNVAFLHADAALARRYPERVRDGERVAVVTTPVYCAALGRDCAQLRLGVSLRSIETAVASLALELSLLCAALVAAAGVATFIAVRRKLLPVRRVTERILQLVVGAADVDAAMRVALETTGANSEVQEVRQLKDALRQFAQVLQRVAVLEREVAAAGAVAELSTQIVHDVRSPLSALKMLGHALPETFEGRELLYRAIDRIATIVRDLERTTERSQAEACALEPLLAELVAEKSLEYRSRPEVKIRLTAPEVWGDVRTVVEPNGLRRVVSNLVNNSIEALDGAGEIEIRTAVDGAHVIVAVADDGRGICPDVLSRLGQRGSTFGKPQGQGLGLYSARQFAEKAGGTFHIDSRESLGTTVTLRFPRA